MVRPKGRPEMLLAEGPECRPWNVVDAAYVTFQHVVPLLVHICQVEGREPHLGVLAGLLATKELLALVQC